MYVSLQPYSLLLPPRIVSPYDQNYILNLFDDTWMIDNIIQTCSLKQAKYNYFTS